MNHKKQIFSIRKCTLGVGSFLIGSFIFFSFSPMQVEAAESTVSSSIQNNDIKSTDPSVESNEAPSEKAADPSVESNEAPSEKAADPSVESNETRTLKEAETSSREKETLEARGVNKASLDSNVNDKVTFSEFELDKNKIHPNSGKYTNLKVKMQVNGNVKGGDTFTFKVPEYVTLNGDGSFKNLNNTMPMNPIKNQMGDIIATGVYNTETKLVTYTFTDIVADRRNIRARLELPIFTDRKNAKASKQYPLSFNFAGEDFNTNLNIDYGDKLRGNSERGGANITSNITDVDFESGKNEYKQTIYVNAKGNNLRDSNVKILGFHTDDALKPLPDKPSSALIDSNNTKVKIYEVVDKTKLNDSYYVDSKDNNLIDVTDKYSQNLKYNNDNTIDINFGDINKAYVIVVDGHYDDSDNNLLTTVAEYNLNEDGKFSGFKWTNDVVTADGSADAEDDTDADA
ncbi:fibrinogen-binding adhesin SdrG C-terminal domain-containing protein, partial [Staphylococcus aureus]